MLDRVKPEERRCWKERDSEIGRDDRALPLGRNRTRKSPLYHDLVAVVRTYLDSVVVEADFALEVM